MTDLATPDTRRPCAFFTSDHGLDIDVLDRLFDAHLAECSRCGRRILGNTSAAFRRALAAPLWRLFAPLAFAETMVTLAVATAITPLSSRELIAAVATAVLGPLIFVYVQGVVVVRLFARRVMPVMRLEFFRTGVGDPQLDRRIPLLHEAVLAYLRFARLVALASFGCYVAAGLAFGVSTSSPGLVVMHLTLGAAWAFLLRARLAAVQLVEVLDIDRHERTWLTDILVGASCMERLLDHTNSLAVTMRLHLWAFALIGGANAITIAYYRKPVAGVGWGALVLSALAWYAAERWIEGRRRAHAVDRDDYKLLASN